MIKKIIEFVQNEDGPTAVEYAIMLALILLFCLATINLMGSATSDSFQQSSDRIQNAMGS